MSRPTPATTPSDDLASLPPRRSASAVREVTIFVGRVDGAAVTIAAAPPAPDHARRTAAHTGSTGRPPTWEEPVRAQSDLEWYRVGQPAGPDEPYEPRWPRGSDEREQPEGEPEEGPVVRLRIAPAGPGLSAATDLAADEVHRIIEHLLALDAARRSSLADADLGANSGPDDGAAGFDTAGRDAAGFDANGQDAAGPGANGQDAAGPGANAGHSGSAARHEPTDGTRITVITAEGTTAGGLRHALASVPAEARLRDFTSDTEVVLVFDEPS